MIRFVTGLFRTAVRILRRLFGNRPSNAYEQVLFTAARNMADVFGTS